MLITQADYKRHANWHRGLSPQYKIGDLIWFDTRNLFTKQPTRKLKNSRTAKYQVKAIISNYAIKLDFPGNLHVCPVIHVNLLKPAATVDRHPSYVQPPGPPIKVDGETKYKVTTIVDSRFSRRTKKLQYRIQWIGYAELNWENAPNMTNVTDLLHDIHSCYRNKLGPLLQIWELAELAPREGVVWHMRSGRSVCCFQVWRVLIGLMSC